MDFRVACRYHPEAFLIEDYRAGDQICSACGLVVGDRVVDVGAEWRTFSNEKGEDKSRVGSSENSLLGSSDLSTRIGPGTGKASFSNDGIALYTKRRTATPASDETLMKAFRIIANMADRINLTEIIVNRANVLYKMVADGGSLRGRSYDAVCSACLYIACRQEGVPRTFKEIVAISTVNKKEIGRCFKYIMKNHDTSVDLITTGDFMSRFCGKLSFAKSVQKAATAIAKRAVDKYLVPGRCPISVAAAAIYMASQASDDKRTHREIGEVAGVADITIKQSYKLMLPKAAELFPDDFKFTTPIEFLPPY